MHLASQKEHIKNLNNPINQSDVWADKPFVNIDETERKKLISQSNHFRR